MTTQPDPTKPGLRMNELAAATGVPKSTILYYLQQGLLPDPVKTSPNMAYYAPECVPIVQFVQQMQRRHRLSLDEIKALLDRWGGDVDLALRYALNTLVFGPPPPDDSLLDRDQFCESTGLTSAQLDNLLAARILLPLEEARFDHHDVQIGEVFAWALSLGFEVEDFTYYVTLGEQIVEQEFALRSKITTPLPYDEDAQITLRMVANARLSRAYIIDRLFQHRVAAMTDIKEQDESGK